MCRAAPCMSRPNNGGSGGIMRKTPHLGNICSPAEQDFAQYINSVPSIKNFAWNDYTSEDKNEKKLEEKYEKLMEI